MKVGDRVDRATGEYSFPGTILAIYRNSSNIEYAVVEMDRFKLQHIFRTSALKPIWKRWNVLWEKNQ